jgi:hypothetical protein
LYQFGGLKKRRKMRDDRIQTEQEALAEESQLCLLWQGFQPKWGQPSIAGGP